MERLRGRGRGGIQAMASSEFVTFRDGFVVDWSIVRRLLDLESRGCSFRLEEGGRFRVVPPDRLTPEDVTFLREHRDDARRVIEYVKQMAEQPC
jgi:hypothetical protein